MTSRVWLTTGGHAVAKLQGEDLLPQGRVEDQDKSSYFSLSSHHTLRRNTNWDGSKRPATVCCWLQGLQGWLSVCLTARGRGLTVLLHRQGRLRGRERVALAHNPSVPDYYEHRPAAKLIKVKEHYLGNKIIKTDGSVWFWSPLALKCAWVLTFDNFASRTVTTVIETQLNTWTSVDSCCLLWGQQSW